MYPHPETECWINAVERKERVATSERCRSAQAAVAHGKNLRGPGAMRQQIGAALVRVGRHLQGESPIDIAAQSSAGLAAASRPSR